MVHGRSSSSNVNELSPSTARRRRRRDEISQLRQEHVGGGGGGDAENSNDDDDPDQRRETPPSSRVTCFDTAPSKIPHEMGEGQVHDNDHHDQHDGENGGGGGGDGGRDDGGRGDGGRDDEVTEFGGGNQQHAAPRSNDEGTTDDNSGLSLKKETVRRLVLEEDATGEWRGGPGSDRPAKDNSCGRDGGAGGSPGVVEAIGNLLLLIPVDVEKLRNMAWENGGYQVRVEGRGGRCHGLDIYGVYTICQGVSQNVVLDPPLPLRATVRV